MHFVPFEYRFLAGDSTGNLYQFDLYRDQIHRTKLVKRIPQGYLLWGVQLRRQGFGGVTGVRGAVELYRSSSV